MPPPALNHDRLQDDKQEDIRVGHQILFESDTGAFPSLDYLEKVRAEDIEKWIKRKETDIVEAIDIRIHWRGYERYEGIGQKCLIAGGKSRAELVKDVSIVVIQFIKVISCKSINIAAILTELEHKPGPAWY
ncbi:hypothetical protein CVT25_015846 [Psilocybe cyanescens]|uniref:Uncharacterized protein n=1 Tax=Psilocybe cyanescens TaxID=93625 RepID=A0A409XTD2_PSICY|nr:hypothetical protein CVT25_015846 [Psilocybe cyanescens]